MTSPLVECELERTGTCERRFALPGFAPGLKQPSAGTYWRTVRHLRRSQIVWLARQRLWRPSRAALHSTLNSIRLANLRKPATFPEWQPAAARRMIASGEFKLLNRTVSGAEKIPWASRTLPRLWVYHLNYCDFVNLDLSRAADRPLLRKALLLMLDWCRQNSTGREAGWEPYPLSLRIVNWMKFLLRNNPHLDAAEEEAVVMEILSSLRCQALALKRGLEFHLRANHLLKNIKALMFAGALLETSESDGWWTQGSALLEEQLREQILRDGGHFERSPMYHAEVFDDLLDLQTIASASGRILACASVLSESITRMSNFLAAMLHPDGEIALFNDSAFDVAPEPCDLLQRARRVTKTTDNPSPAVKVMPETGYAVLRDASSKSRLIFDCGAIGPDYQPGHAHCDVLSYELSLDGQRVVVDTGTSTYEPGPERHYERSTAAHNTLRIDSEEQAEIWASFRVGRRPNVSSIESGQVGGFHFVRGSHDGYRRLGVVHSRQIILCPGNCWIVVDSLQGSGSHRIESFIHLHPEVQAKVRHDFDSASSKELRKRFVINFAGRRYYFLASNTGTLALKDAWYSPEFGRRQNQAVIYWNWTGQLPVQVVYAFVPAGRDIPNVLLEADGMLIKIDHLHIPLV